MNTSIYAPTYRSNFVFLAFTEAEIAGGRFCHHHLTPSMAHNSQTLSRERVQLDSEVAS